MSITVRPTTQTLSIGSRAVPVKNPTSRDLPMEQIDTSPIPDPSFHVLSISDAIASGRPSVIAFATPSFCVSRTCGPAMEVVTEVWRAAPDQFNVVHVEPYQLSPQGELLLDANKQRINSEAGNLWRLPSEPWVFVVDAKGVIVARFDGPFALDELTSALGEAGVRG